MKLKEIITEGTDHDKNPNGPEIKLPIYTKQKFDYGEKANKLQSGDIVMKASDSGNIYGRRHHMQRTVKPMKKSSMVK